MTLSRINPHDSRQKEQLTTRTALYNENAIDGGTSAVYEGELEKDKIQRLHSLVLQTLGISSISSLEWHRTKRRQLGSESPQTNVPSSSIPFRLVSSVLPPKPISLAPAHSGAIHHQRPVEDTAAEEQLRHERAQQVAVDADWVLMQSRVRSNLFRGSSVPILCPITSDTTSRSQLPNIFVTERAPLSRPSAEVDNTVTKVKCCPLIPVHDFKPISIRTKKRKRKRAHPRVRPNF